MAKDEQAAAEQPEGEGSKKKLFIIIEGLVLREEAPETPTD